MMGDAYPRIVTGFQYIAGQWYLVWDRNLYSIPQTYDRAIMLINLIPPALRTGRDNCIPPNLFGPMNKYVAQYDLKIVISEFESFSEEGDYLIETTFNGAITAIDVEENILLLWIRKIVRDAEAEVLQAFLSQP